MSTTPKDGGPAFPLFLPPSETGANIFAIQYGMSLRDYYAGQALIGLLGVAHADGLPLSAVDDGNEKMARVCFWFADAMLKERAKERA